MQSYYDVLGVTTSANDEEIKNAYRQLAKKFHPDLNKAPDAEAKFKQINEAYDALKDAERRAHYENELRFQNARNHSKPHGPQPGFGFQHDMYDFDDILKNMQRNGQWKPQWAPRNRDVNLNYTVTLAEAFTGKEQELRYAPPGAETQEMKVKIPPGIENGVRIRYVGKGESTHKNVPPGDLYVTINITKDERFVRHGVNLSTTVQIDYIDAILGTEALVSTIDGSQIKVKIPENTIVGQTLRIPEKGMPIGGNPSRRGDLHVELLITPPKLTNEQLDLLRKVKPQKTH